MSARVPLGPKRGPRSPEPRRTSHAVEARTAAVPRASSPPSPLLDDWSFLNLSFASPPAENRRSPSPEPAYPSLAPSDVDLNGTAPDVAAGEDASDKDGVTLNAALDTPYSPMAPAESGTGAQDPTFDRDQEETAALGAAAVSKLDDAPAVVDVVALRLPTPDADEVPFHPPSLHVVSDPAPPSFDDARDAHVSVVAWPDEADSSKTDRHEPAALLSVVAAPGVSGTEASSFPRVAVAGGPAEAAPTDPPPADLRVALGAVATSPLDVLPAAISLEVRTPEGAMDVGPDVAGDVRPAVRVTRSDVAPAWQDTSDIPDVVILEGAAESTSGASERLSVAMVAGAPDLATGPDGPLHVTALSEVIEHRSAGTAAVQVVPGPLAEGDGGESLVAERRPSAPAVTGDHLGAIAVVARPVAAGPVATPEGGPETIAVTTRVAEGDVDALTAARASIHVAPLALPTSTAPGYEETSSGLELEVVPTIAASVVTESTTLTLAVVEAERGAESPSVALAAHAYTGLVPDDVPLDTTAPPAEFEVADADVVDDAEEGHEVSNDLVESVAGDDWAEVDAQDVVFGDKMAPDGASPVDAAGEDDAPPPFGRWGSPADDPNVATGDEPPLFPDEPPEASFADEPTWPPGTADVDIDYLVGAMELASRELTSAISTVLDDAWDGLEDDVELRHEGPDDGEADSGLAAMDESRDAAEAHARAAVEAEAQARAAEEAQARAAEDADAEAQA
ncbi:MAG: hypothetical protein IV100_27255, partial [Myxococcales bacterium]|nr:hypothetical protein [Myxococcales bacterium]